jgi:hypothetical protein
MKKAPSNKHEPVEMAPEYNFEGKKGIRGKYYASYRKGHQVRVYKEDGTVTVTYFTLQEGAVMLEPDVRKYFPDSETVNTALRSLIALIPDEPAKRRPTSKPQ